MTAKLIGITRDPMDTYTESGANELARRIRRYWGNRGYLVQTELYRIRKSDGAIGVRSDMKNGLPWDYTGKKRFIN